MRLLDRHHFFGASAFGAATVWHAATVKQPENAGGAIADWAKSVKS